MLEQGATPIQGPHQGGWVETPSGQGWFAHFNSTGAFGRIVHLQPVQWQDDWPVIGRPIAGKQSGQPVASFAMPDTSHAPTADRLQDPDEFATQALGLQWSWNHNPLDGAWSLAARPGWLRLEAQPAQHLVTARNTLTQILLGPHPTYTARIDTRGMTDGQRAGLALFGVRPSWVGVVREDGRRRVTLASEGVETHGAELTGDTIELRAEVSEGQAVRYSFSLDGGRTFVAFGDPISARAVLVVERFAPRAVQLYTRSGRGRGRRRLVSRHAVAPRRVSSRPRPDASRRRRGCRGSQEFVFRTSFRLSLPSASAMCRGRVRRGRSGRRGW